VTAFLDTNVLVRHLTGDPASMAEKATTYLSGGEQLLLTDLVVAETAYVLSSYYEAPRDQVATALRSIIAFPSITTIDPALLLRAIEVFEVDRLDFAEAYLVANAETTGIGRIASFDRTIDRISTVERIEP
jgi:predicted nucleic acid-binding protein